MLIYLSFRQQFRANQLQQSALQKEIQDKLIEREYYQIEALFRTIKEDINSLEFASLREPKRSFKRKGFDEFELEHYSSKGLSSIIEFKSNLKYTYTTKEYKLSFLQQLNHVLYQIKYLEQKIFRFTVHKFDKEYFVEIIKSYYRNMLEPLMMDIRQEIDDLSDNSFYDKEYTKFKELTAYLATIFNTNPQYDN